MSTNQEKQKDSSNESSHKSGDYGKNTPVQSERDDKNHKHESKTPESIDDESELEISESIGSKGGNSGKSHSSGKGKSEKSL